MFIKFNFEVKYEYEKYSRNSLQPLFIYKTIV